MNVFLMTDLEGIAGINTIDDMDRNSELYKISCKHLEHSIDLAADACFANGADRVYYLDSHGGGGNVDAEKIDPRATKISLAQWSQLLAEGAIDCVIEIGSHARAGTLCGFLDHTLMESIFCITANGREMSELSQHALICAKYNVPIVAVVGDETACQQAKEYIPDIAAGAIKIASRRNEARTYPDSDEILVRTVAQGLKNYRSISIMPFEEPLVMRRTYCRADMCEEVLANGNPDIRRIDARTLEKTIIDLVRYEDLNFI